MEQPAVSDCPPPSIPPLVPPPAGTSAMAVWSLVTGLLCIPLAPVILGFMAMSQIKAGGGRQKGRGFAIAGITLGGCMLLIGPIAVLAGLATPAILRARKSADLTVAMNNMRQLGVCLYQFEQEWGTFPSEAILRENPENFPGVRQGGSSNALLSMLVAGGHTRSEEIFAAPGATGGRGRADNVISPALRLLEPGECGMGYVLLAGGRAMSSMNNGGRPLLVTPLERGESGADPRFSSQPYNGRAVYLRIDQSVQQNQIDRDGRVQLPGRVHLFETGENTVWGADIPEVAPPEW